MKKIIKSEEGQGLVEFALVLPILILLICGIIDFGWIFYNHLAMENACREGARFACVNGAEYKVDAAATEDDIKSKVLENVPGGLKADLQVVVTFTATEPTDGDVIVSVESKMNILTPVFATLYGNEKDVSSSITMKVES